MTGFAGFLGRSWIVIGTLALGACGGGGVGEESPESIDFDREQVSHSRPIVLPDYGCRL